VTIKAKATKAGLADSEVVSKTIRVLRRAKTPRFVLYGTPFESEGPAKATYVLRANLSIVTDTPNATILYTTSGAYACGCLPPFQPTFPACTH
jgi:hypothetical protein